MPRKSPKKPRDLGLKADGTPRLRREGAGRPKHTPTPELRKTVEAMAGYGMPFEQIAAALGLSEHAVRKHYRRELSRGVPKANAKVVESLFFQATGRPVQYDDRGRVMREEQKPNVAAAIWWTKARMGWKETSVSQLEGKPDGTPIPLRLDSLNDAQLDQLLSRVERRLQTLAAGG